MASKTRAAKTNAIRADRLRQVLERRRLTQMDIVNDLDMSQAQVSRYFNGRGDPSLPILKRIAEYLEVSTDYLLGLSPDPVPVGSTTEARVKMLVAMFESMTNEERLKVFDRLSAMRDKRRHENS